MLVILMVAVALLTSLLFLKNKGVIFLLAIICSAVYFYFFNGSILNFLIYTIGVVLLLLEVYVPDFGIMGVVGACSVTFSLYKPGAFSELAIMIFILISTMLIVLTIFLKLGYQLSLSPYLVLNKSLNHAMPSKESLENHYVGVVGTVIETLRPVGKVKLQNDVIIEAISEMGYIDEQHLVKIIAKRNGQYYVRAVKEERI